MTRLPRRGYELRRAAGPDAWPLRLELEAALTGALSRDGHLNVIHLRMADVATLASWRVARRLGIAVVFTLAADPHTGKIPDWIVEMSAASVEATRASRRRRPIRTRYGRRWRRTDDWPAWRTEFLPRRSAGLEDYVAFADACLVVVGGQVPITMSAAEGKQSTYASLIR